MVVDYLEQVVFAVFKNHVDGSILEYCFNVVDYVWVVQLGAETHFAYGRLGDSSIDGFIFAFRFKSVFDVLSQWVVG